RRRRSSVVVCPRVFTDTLPTTSSSAGSRKLSSVATSTSTLPVTWTSDGRQTLVTPASTRTADAQLTFAWAATSSFEAIKISSGGSEHTATLVAGAHGSVGSVHGSVWVPL